MPSLPSVDDRLVRTDSKGSVAKVTAVDPYHETVELYWGTREPGSVSHAAVSITETVSFERCYREFEQAS